MSAVYSAGGVVTSLTNPAGGNRQYIRSSTSTQTIVTASGPQGSGTTQYELDFFKRITKQVDALGGTQTWSYDDFGHLLKYSDELGGGLALNYSPAGQIVARSVWRTTDRYVTDCYSYYTTGAKAGKLRTLESNCGIFGRDRRSYDYDDKGMLVAEIEGAANDATAPRTTYAYTAGDSTTPSGLLARVTDQVGAATTYTYSPDGSVRSSTDPAGLTSTYTYDSLGRTTKRTTSGQGVSAEHTIEWNDDGTARAIVEPRVTGSASGVTRQLRRTTVTDFDGLVTAKTISDLVSGITTSEHYEYDNAGQLIEERATDNSVTARYAYDAAGNLAEIEDGTGNRKRLTYDLLGRPLTTTVVNYLDPISGQLRDLVTQEITYDAAGRPSSVRRPNQPERQYTYTLDGNITDVVAIGGAENGGDLTEHKWTYNGRGLPTSHSTPSSPTMYYAYDALERLTETRFHSTVSTYTYDAAGRITSETSGSAAATAAQTQYSYDTAGRVVAATSGFAGTSATQRFAYDAAGRVISSIDPRGSGIQDATWSTRYEYDASGALVRRIDPEITLAGAPTHPITAYGHDALGRLQVSVDPAGGRTEHSYDAAGRLQKITEPAVLVAGEALKRPTRSWTYDQAGRVLTSTSADGLATRYIYDALGQIITRTDPPTTPT